MFTKHNYNEYQDLMNKFQGELKRLEEMRREINGIISDVQDKCEHDLIVAYECENNLLVRSNIKHAQCLVCNSYLELDSNFEMFSEREINIENILDITPYISEENMHITRGNENIYFTFVKETLKEIMNREESFTLCEIKKMIIEFVKEYDKYLCDKKGIKKVLKRG